MNTLLINSKKTKEISKILKNDGIIAFPTDTVFGLGCVYDSELAINKIKKAKNRDENKPLPFMCADKETIYKIAKVNAKAAKIIDKLMPGALTIVLEKKNSIPDYITNGFKTIAIRIPNDELVLNILKELGKPMLVTSANISDFPSCHNYLEVVKQLDGRIDAIIRGDSQDNLASTIVLATNEDDIKIIRQGIITIDDINEVLKGE